VAEWKTPPWNVFQFEFFDRVDRIPGADHVVPLEKLMEHDPVA